MYIGCRFGEVFDAYGIVSLFVCFLGVILLNAGQWSVGLKQSLILDDARQEVQYDPNYENVSKIWGQLNSIHGL